MTEILFFLIGCLVVEIITRYKINKVMNQLHKVCNSGEQMWEYGIKYAMDQIRKYL